MGGPCKLVIPGHRLKKIGPQATDNFQVAPFIYNGLEYQSCEQAYQACKYSKGSEEHELIRGLRPYRNEKDSAFGMRCWRIGQSGSKMYRSDWDIVKVGVMYEVNLAKYKRHPELQQDLLNTGTAEIRGGPSTSWTIAGVAHSWSYWNGVIQERIREELRKTREPGLLEDLIARFEAYEGAGAGETCDDKRARFETGEQPQQNEYDRSMQQIPKTVLKVPTRLENADFLGEEAGLQNDDVDNFTPCDDAATAQTTLGDGLGPTIMSLPIPQPQQEISQVVYIGDVHGHLSKLTSLWQRLEEVLGDQLLHSTVVFLGDYCDRGPDTKGVLDWLIALKASRRPGRTEFICGNHDFGMAAFLGVLPATVPPGFDLDSTRNPKYECGFWPYPVEGGMHYQGRRWGGSVVYQASETFRSYGVEWLPFDQRNREELLKAVPQSHKDFLSGLLWVHEKNVWFPPSTASATATGKAEERRVIAVHAGL